MKALSCFGVSWYAVFLIGSIFIACSAFADLLPFPLSANQRGYVNCLENPFYTYDVYLPPGYSTNGTPLPILFTMNASGGGMVTAFQNTCSKLNIILIGLMDSQNGMPWDRVLREIYAVTRDVRQRVLFDPTAEFAGGFSGGGTCSYMFSRFRSQHVAGVLEMAGWLGRANMGASVRYYSTDRVQTNLLIARTTGTADTGAIFYNVFDSNYLAYCRATIKDWTFGGSHGVPPDSVKAASLTWLVSQRIPAAPDDRTNAFMLATNWQSRITAGEQEAVLRECVSNLMNRPRSWFAYEAQLTLDQLLADYPAFRLLDVSNLAQGDFATDLFYFCAHGAATNADWPRYDSSMKALTGITATNELNGTFTISGIRVTVVIPSTNGIVYITGTNADRAGDIYSLLTKYNHYSAPQLRYSPNHNPSQMHLWLSKGTPGLTYSLQLKSNLVTDTWQDVFVSANDTNTLWSTEVDVPPNSDSGYFRIRAAPLPALSPPWTYRGP